jgi:glycerol-1-phosphatase
MEGLLPKLHGKDAVEIPGARALLEQLIPAGAPWAIVTSGTTPLVTGWLDVLKLPHPEHLVTAESVQNGKPDPACYELGRSKLQLAADSRVLVFEDSPAGIASGKAAGCKVIGLVTSHTLEQVMAAEPDWIVRDLRSVRMITCRDGIVTLEISDALTRASAN